MASILRAQKTLQACVLADKSVELSAHEIGIGYLDMDAIFDVASRMKGSRGIHPGYGFLSRRLKSLERCEEEGFVFIGPNPRAMKSLGSKLSARAFMKKVLGSRSCQAPWIHRGTPRTPRSRPRRDRLPHNAEGLGRGGGRGMRVVNTTRRWNR